jgi:hypothetical protein
MTLRTYSIDQDTASGAPAGAYVSAEDAAKLEETLSTLIWSVLYGKPFDGSRAAVQAEQVLTGLRVRPAVEAAA